MRTSVEHQKQNEASKKERIELDAFCFLRLTIAVLAIAHYGPPIETSTWALQWDQALESTA